MNRPRPAALFPLALLLAGITAARSAPRPGISARAQGRLDARALPVGGR